MIAEEMRRDASEATGVVKEYATGNAVTRGLGRTKRMVGRRFTSVKRRAKAEIEDTKRAARAATERIREE